MSLLIAVAVMTLGLFVAHLMSWRMAEGLRAAFGRAREVMPSLPASPPQRGGAQARWDRRVFAVEGRLIDHLKGGATRVEASQLAAQLGEPVEVVEAALARLREEIPHRLQITRAGRLLHDFTAEDIEAIRSRRARSAPSRLAWFSLAAAANIGAAWPAIATALVAGFALYEMSTAAEGEALVAGIAGLLLVGVLVGGTLLLGWIMRALMHAWNAGPKLAAQREAEPQPAWRRDDMHLYTASQGADVASDVAWLGYLNSNSSTPSAGLSFSDSASSGGSWFSGDWDLDFDGDDLGGVAVVIVAILLIAILASALAIVGVWARGIWRAVRDATSLQTVSPTLWVRSADTLDTIERFIPTNDLALRAWRAVRRMRTHRRPEDQDMAARLLLLARANEGRLSALDIALHEGLDLDEAAEVGARLCGFIGGTFHVSDSGDLLCVFPPQALERLTSEADPDLWAEYITFGKNATRRRDAQSDEGVPVNLVGLTRGHLHALDRLVAGSIIMALMGAAALTATSTAVAAPLALALAFMAVGTMGLSTSARYAANVAASHGVQRDIRRAAVHLIRERLHQPTRPATVDLGALAHQLHNTFSPAWSALTIEDVTAEVRGVCVDLDLEPHLDAIAASNDAQSAELYDLRPLRERYDALACTAVTLDTEGLFGERIEREEVGDDEVIFDTQVQLAQVTALA